MYYTYAYAIQVCTAGPSYCVHLERKLQGWTEGEG